MDSECKYVLWTTALAFLCLNSFWRTVARLIISPMLKHTEQVALAATRGPLWGSSAQSQAPATHISILYTDKWAFSLPGKFSHERMKCKRLLPHSFLSAHRVVYVGICVCVCVRVSSRKRQMYQLIIQIQNKPERWREAALVTGQCDGVLAYVGTRGGEGGGVKVVLFFSCSTIVAKIQMKYCDKHNKCAFLEENATN